MSCAAVARNKCKDDACVTKLSAACGRALEQSCGKDYISVCVSAGSTAFKRQGP